MNINYINLSYIVGEMIVSSIYQAIAIAGE